MKAIFFIPIFFILYFILCLVGCNSQTIIDIQYEKNKRQISFQKTDKIDISHLTIKAYWKDSLLFSTPVDYNEETERCYIDAFPNKQIAGLLCKKSLDLITEICYHIGKNKRLPVRYKLIDNNQEQNIVLFDTIITLHNILLDKCSIKRAVRINKIPIPQIDFNETGYKELMIVNYYNLIKAKLYTKGIHNLSDDILIDAAYHLDLLLNEGYQKLIIPQNKNFSNQTKKYLSVHISDSIPKAYLLQVSLSGCKNAKDFGFSIKDEISDFISVEYTKGFPKATINNNEYINIPIQKVGIHKYNFVQLLCIIYILKNNNFLISPIGYTFTIDKKEVDEYSKEDLLVKAIVNPIGWSIIDDYFIDYSQLLQH